MPEPTTSTASSGFRHVPAHRVHGHRDGFDQRGVLERQTVRKPVEDPRGHGHVLRKGAVAAVLAARHAEHLAVVAQVDLALPAELALPQETVESNVTRSPTAEPFDRAARLAR